MKELKNFFNAENLPNRPMSFAEAYKLLDVNASMHESVFDNLVDETVKQLQLTLAVKIVEQMEVGPSYVVRFNSETTESPLPEHSAVICRMSIDNLVRCAECRKWHPEIGWCDEHSYFVDSEGMACSPAESPSWKMFPPDYFCKDGERKNDD